MESEILEAFNPAEVGLALSNFADDSAYVQLRYQVTPNFSFGGSITYKSEMFGGQPDTAAGFNAAINDYSIVGAELQRARSVRELPAFRSLLRAPERR